MYGLVWPAHRRGDRLTTAGSVGANLARTEIGLIFDEIADIMPNIAKLSEPQRLRSAWINGVKELSRLGDLSAT
ncbi:MAG: hypothetical protein JOZ49_20590 [Mycolicibacterium sp.]|nr:hypothetical protein [Mycolicibacterium sp.]